MMGEGQLREQAKKQWEKIDAEGRKIINDLSVADKKKNSMARKHRAKVHQEERNKIDQSGIRHKNQEIHACT